ncbi:hypothetical protein, partial [Moraxella osloensis]|uniref:hypothetical protein n=1 Tax=Faucicola osloensis TaxID=34062 RepID=UPI002432B1DC
RVTTTVVAIRQQYAKPIADSLYRWLQEKRQLTSKNASITVSPRPSHLFHRKLKRDNVHDFQ